MRQGEKRERPIVPSGQPASNLGAAVDCCGRAHPDQPIRLSHQTTVTDSGSVTPTSTTAPCIKG